MQLNICDRCGRNAKELHHLKEEYSGLEICDKCWKSWCSHHEKASIQVGEFRNRVMAEAVKKWLDEAGKSPAEPKRFLGRLSRYFSRRKAHE